MGSGVGPEEGWNGRGPLTPKGTAPTLRYQQQDLN